MENIRMKQDYLQKCNFLQLKTSLQSEIIDPIILQYIEKNSHIVKYTIVKYVKTNMMQIEFFDTNNNKFSTLYESQNDLFSDLSFFQKYNTSIWKDIIENMNASIKNKIKKDSIFSLSPIELVMRYIAIDPYFDDYLAKLLNIPVKDIDQYFA